MRKSEAASNPTYLYHGTAYTNDFYSIIKYGFKRIGVRTYLGRGIYLTKSIDRAYSYAMCNSPDYILWGAVVSVRLKKSTRILDISAPPDKSTLNYLKKEFGKDIINPFRFHLCIPRNKHLTKKEIIALCRYFHHQQEDDTPAYDRALGKSRMPQYLHRYQYDGYGDANGPAGVSILKPFVIEEVKYVNPLGRHIKIQHEVIQSDEMLNVWAVLNNFKISEKTESQIKKQESFYRLLIDPWLDMIRDELIIQMACFVNNNRDRVYIGCHLQKQKFAAEYDTIFFQDLDQLGIEVAKQMQIFKQLINEIKLNRNC